MEWSDLQEIAYDNLNDALFFAASGQAETRAFAIRGGDWLLLFAGYIDRLYI
ncbi:MULTISPECIES: hypothetical protein [unclassified Paenibacillus]|uniref:hypothetical protein n=1 Tax=unclassified Paenibacillus TaxID=185978 RepID=UPI000A670B6F|nr:MULTISPECIES: hypothetical protein [unclassified Paenibacillus]